MNDLIIQELRYDLEEKIRHLLTESKETCYLNNKQTMQGSRNYMQCVLQKQKQIQTLQKTAKDKLLFIQLSAHRNPNFSLTQSISNFIQQYQLYPQKNTNTIEQSNK